ncbi:50S ribosomal protein L5 [Prosthecobacter vanneervenii]|uniref:Large ribosomal subunit protein uL5 n=1 Tax=Prosthecobacter vanneervenii TaxID=48466 RepID=A0A7W7Y800_9BACT|nr:50S ribosomal protein L5 [Prosthecobacter vanneervenii]MBB5031286.1 large subunit ribosomal protein L5 [Prosthecobacter vanneervenii]
MEHVLQTLYKQKRTELKSQLGLANIHQVPQLQKIVVNCSIGSQGERKQAIEDAVNEVTLITGQKPVITKSKKAIANFKLRQGENVGVKVTLRGGKMYDFMMRLVRTAIPRIRDFRGVAPRAFDGRGNYTLGVSEQSIFPEIELDKIKRPLGFDITFVTSTNNDDHAREMLRALGMPFRTRTAQKKEEGAEAAAA